MKPSELMIGNYLKAIHPRFGEDFIKVESIGLESINLDFRSYNLSELKPIPLTEDWLLRLGFKKQTNIYWIQDWDYSIEQTSVVDFVWYHDQLSDYYANHIEYIHQLQNLYFALTGEELILT